MNTTKISGQSVRCYDCIVIAPGVILFTPALRITVVLLPLLLLMRDTPALAIPSEQTPPAMTRLKLLLLFTTTPPPSPSISSCVSFGLWFSTSAGPSISLRFQLLLVTDYSVIVKFARSSSKMTMRTSIYLVDSSLAVDARFSMLRRFVHRQYELKMKAPDSQLLSRPACSRS